MKKRKKILTKLSLFFAMALLCIISFVVPTKAYYQDTNGNLVSDNHFGVENTNYENYGVTISISNGVISVSGTANSSQWIMFPLVEDLTNNTYTFSFSNNSIYSNFGFSRVASMGGSGTEWFQISSNPFTRNITDIKYFGVAIFNGTTYTDYSTTIMCSIGSSALAYEPFGTYYSQTNYNNFGSSQYAQGYTDGYNSIYNNLVDVNLSNQINGIGIGIYDSTGENFIQRATISSSGFENNYYYVNFNSLVNNYYVVNIGFNDSYLINSFAIQTANVSNPSLEANGNMLGVSSNYGYNGTTYGWHNISFNEPVNQITFRFQNTRDLTELKLYINGKRLNVLDSLESYNEGLENGKEIGYNNGYSDGYAQGSKDNTEITSSGFKVLFNSILSYPVNFFREVFNFEFMGINIAALITFIISLVIVGFIWNKFRK